MLGSSLLKLRSIVLGIMTPVFYVVPFIVYGAAFPDFIS